MKRPGFYVAGRFYDLSKRAQALAQATFRATEYGRDVEVIRVDHALAEWCEFVAEAGTPAFAEYTRYQVAS